MRNGNLLVHGIEKIAVTVKVDKHIAREPIITVSAQGKDAFDVFNITLFCDVDPVVIFNDDREGR